MTYEEIKSVHYRRERFVRIAGRMERRLLGLDRSLIPFTRGKDGSHSEKKTRALAEGLVQGFRTFRAYEQSDIVDPETLEIKGSPQEFEKLLQDDDEQEKKFEELLRNYFYCVLRLRKCDSALGPFFLRSRGEAVRFGDLLDMLGELEYTPFDEDELIHDELTDHSGPLEHDPGNLFTVFNYFYDRLTDKAPLPDLIPKEKQRDQIDGKETFLHRRVLPGLLEEDALFDTMTYRKEFARAYRAFRKAWFDPELFGDRFGYEYFLEQVEGGIITFLASEGLNYLNDEDYFPAYGLLDRTEKQLAQLLQGE